MSTHTNWCCVVLFQDWIQWREDIEQWAGGEGKAYNEVIIGKKRIIYRQYFHLIDFKIYKLFLSIFYNIRIICDKSRNSFFIYGNSFDLILSLSLSPRLIKDNYNWNKVYINKLLFLVIFFINSFKLI